MSENTYDVIIAGGGTCGLIIASRLATADPSLSILVVEAGAPTRDDPKHIQPARYSHHLRPDSTTVKFNVGRESAALGGRAPVVPCGQVLGGGSSVNFTMYTRAAASDYDDWATVYGNPGWSSKELVPLLRKCETYEIAPGKPTHGYNGPLKVSWGGAFMDIGKEFLDVAGQYDKARGITEDINGLFETNKYGRWQKFIDSKTGVRSDIPHYYIYNHDFEKLHIKTGHHVKRVIIKDGRATGIEYSPNKLYHPDSANTVLKATARRLVIITAGAFGSPAILERSGIGAKSVLEKFGIEQVVDLPRVGENYQDHQVIFAPYAVNEDLDTLDGIARSTEEFQTWEAQWKKQGDGLMAHNGLDAGGKLRPNQDELELLGDVFRKRWTEYYAPAPDKPVMWLGLLALYLGDLSKTHLKKAYCVGWYVQHPMSLGHVHITDANDVESPLDFHPGYLDRPEDMAVHRWGYRMSREFARRMPSYRGEFPGAHPVFKEGSAAVAGLHDGPVPIDAPNLAFTEEDDKIVEEWVRQAVGTAWHSMGTCAMKSRESGGVLDSRLNVYGVQGLKVADISICPGNVAANTYSTAIAIGEKAAVIIGQDLGLHIDEGASI